MDFMLTLFFVFCDIWPEKCHQKLNKTFSPNTKRLPSHENYENPIDLSESLMLIRARIKLKYLKMT